MNFNPLDDSTQENIIPEEQRTSSSECDCCGEESSSPSPSSPILPSVEWSNVLHKPTCFPACTLPIPVGTIWAYAPADLTSDMINQWDFCDGGTLDGTDPLYANLFASIGLIYGGSSTNFKKPNLKGRTIIGVGNNGTSDYALGDTGGVESYVNASVGVTASTPAITISFSNMGSVIFPTFDAGNFPTLNSGVFPALNPDGNFPTLNSGNFPTLDAGTMSSVDNDGVFPDYNITKDTTPCINVAETGGSSVLDCSTGFNAVKSGGNFPTVHAGSAPSLNSDGNLPSLNTDGNFPTLSGGTLPTLNSDGNLPSSTGGSNTVSGISATSPSTSITGATASIDVPTIPPYLVLNYIIKL